MKTTTHLFGFLSSLFLNITLLAQGPNCTSAESLMVNTVCTTVQWTNSENGTIPGGWSQPCGGGNDYQDIWYQILGIGAEVGVNQLTFDLTSVSAGLYFVNYAYALGVTVKHIVKR